MGWNSSYLGSNVVSSYLQIDNLRMDILAGKFWDTGATKYLQNYHDGTDAWLISSSGDIYLKSAGNDTFITDSTGAKYVKFNISTNKTISTEAGALYLSSFTGEVDIYLNATVGVLNVHSGTVGKYLSISHNVTDGAITSVTGGLQLGSTTGLIFASVFGTTTYFKAFETGGSYYIMMGSNALASNKNGMAFTCLNQVFAFGASGTQTQLQFYDTGATAWKTAAINNGAWVIS